MGIKQTQWLRIVRYVGERIPDPLAAHSEVSWQEYHQVRNAVVRACRQYGPTGPLGECPITNSKTEPDVIQWENGDPNPSYFVVDDQLNDERYIYIEVLNPTTVSTDWIISLSAALRAHPYWGVGVSNIPEGYIIIFCNMILVQGDKLFAGRVDDLVENARRAISDELNAP